MLSPFPFPLLSRWTGPPSPPHYPVPRAFRPESLGRLKKPLEKFRFNPFKSEPFLLCGTPFPSVPFRVNRAEGSFLYLRDPPAEVRFKPFSGRSPSWFCHAMARVDVLPSFFLPFQDRDLLLRCVPGVPRGSIYTREVSSISSAIDLQSASCPDFLTLPFPMDWFLHSLLHPLLHSFNEQIAAEKIQDGPVSRSRLLAGGDAPVPAFFRVPSANSRVLAGICS